MLLAIDVGNTNIHFGLFDGMEPVHASAVPCETPDALPEAVGDANVTGIALASVAPNVTERLIPLLGMRYVMPVLMAGRDLPYGIDIQCDAPEKVGADRILNAVAAYRRTQRATIVVDVGSAVTVDLVSERGSFCGGAIAPGPRLMLNALHEHTELLPETVLSEAPPRLGRDTRAAIRAGIYWGTVGLTDRLIAEIAEDRGVRGPALITGGGGEWVASLLKAEAEFVAHLTLEGLAILAQGAAST